MRYVIGKPEPDCRNIYLEEDTDGSGDVTLYITDKDGTAYSIMTFKSNGNVMRYGSVDRALGLPLDQHGQIAF